MVKVKNFQISAKEAYDEYDSHQGKEYRDYTNELTQLIVRGGFDINLLHNDLELPLREKYHPINNMKRFVKNSLMSGSGPTFFILNNHFDIKFEPDEFWFVENLRTIGKGVEEIK